MLRFSGQNYAAMGSRWQDGPQETPPRPRVHRRAQGRGPSPQPLLRDQDAEARRTSRWSRAIEEDNCKFFIQLLGLRQIHNFKLLSCYGSVFVVNNVEQKYKKSYENLHHKWFHSYNTSFLLASALEWFKITQRARYINEEH